jgi:hypothetical protein
MEPVYGVLLSAIPSPSGKALWMLFDPLKGVEGLLDLVGCGNALKDMILKEVIGGITGFLGLKNDTRVSEMGNLCDMGFLFGFSEDIFGEVLKNTTVRVKILALHLTFRGFPGGARGVGAAPFDHEELFWITRGMEKEAGSQINPPSFDRMLHIGVGFHWIVGEMSGSAVETWLEHIKGFHLPCAVFLERVR